MELKYLKNLDNLSVKKNIYEIRSKIHNDSSIDLQFNQLDSNFNKLSKLIYEFTSNENLFKQPKEKK